MFRPNAVIRVASTTMYVLQASLMMIPWGRNMQLGELFYKVMPDGYLFIAYSTAVCTLQK